MDAHYSCNHMVMGKGPGVATVTRQMIKKPSIILRPAEVTVIGDNALGTGIPYFNFTGELAFRHDLGEIRPIPSAKNQNPVYGSPAKANLLYYDGHVSPSTSQQLKAIPYAAEAKAWNAANWNNAFQCNGIFVPPQ